MPIVLLHEIGHDVLHRQEARTFQEFSIFDIKGDRMEYEANSFAAEVALPDEEVLEKLRLGLDVETIAKQRVPASCQFDDPSCLFHNIHRSVQKHSASFLSSFVLCYTIGYHTIIVTECLSRYQDYRPTPDAGG